MEADKLTIKLVPSYREALKRLSQLEQEPMAVLVRRLVRAEAQRRGLWPAADQQEAAPC